MVSMSTRLNIEKLDGNIVQKHGGSKQDKQPGRKTNTDCLVKEQEKEYQTGWKIKTGIQQQNGLVDVTNVTLFAKLAFASRHLQVVIYGLHLQLPIRKQAFAGKHLQLSACILHLHLPIAAFIYSLHLHLAFASCNLQLAFAFAFASCRKAFAAFILHLAIVACICSLHLHLVIAACICSLDLHLANVACICSLHLQVQGFENKAKTDKIMVAAGGNILRKTPQEAYDLIENMSQHHFQWDAEVYYDTTTGVSAHYSKTTSSLSAQIESDEDEHSKVLDIHKPVHSLSGNPTPSSDSIVESLSPLPTPFGDSDSLLEETDTLLSHSEDSLPDYETFCFDIEEKRSGSTTSHYDLSLLEYESFHFDLSIDQLPPADRSDFYHKEFADELAHVISPPEYHHFYFDLEDDPGELTRLLKENIFDTSTKDITINELNDFPLLLSDCDSTFSEEFSEIDLLVSFPSENKDKFFYPEIFIIVQSQRFHILPLDDFSTISFVSNSLFLTDPFEIETYLSFPSGNEDKVFDPGILLIDGVLSFTRKTPHPLSDNFKIDKRHILSETSLKSVSSVSFHPKDKEIRGESS
ncbi:hypothetical protein Tco_1175719 [Tanacetum coccineum]|uniref:Reverse transcriptase domain-containing protein n=1 Tax=Tanacetum coccineum TaxID=301880 RepID=A0ABQ5BQ09_9ASTR